MQNTLLVAQETADEVKKSSEQKSAVLMKETEIECKKQQEEIAKYCDKMKYDSELEANRIKSDAETYAEKIRKEADEYAARARSQADDYDKLTRSDADSYAAGPVSYTHLVKLYFMVGLPGETEEDVEEIIRLVRRVRARMEELGHKGELTLSVNAFVPKPFTPYQWSPLEEVKELKQRFKQLQNGLKKERRIRLLTESLKETVLQAALARGDRRLSAVLLLAAREEIGLKDAFRRAEIDLSLIHI